MARPQVKDGEMVAFITEGSCEYTKYAVANSRQWVVFQVGSRVGCKKTVTIKTYQITRHITESRAGLVNEVMNFAGCVKCGEIIRFS